MEFTGTKRQRARAEKTYASIDFDYIRDAVEVDLKFVPKWGEDHRKEERERQKGQVAAIFSKLPQVNDGAWWTKHYKRFEQRSEYFPDKLWKFLLKQFSGDLVCGKSVPNFGPIPGGLAEIRKSSEAEWTKTLPAPPAELLAEAKKRNGKIVAGPTGDGYVGADHMLYFRGAELKLGPPSVAYGWVVSPGLKWAARMGPSDRFHQIDLQAMTTEPATKAPKGGEGVAAVSDTHWAWTTKDALHIGPVGSFESELSVAAHDRQSHLHGDQRHTDSESPPGSGATALRPLDRTYGGCKTASRATGVRCRTTSTTRGPMALHWSPKSA